ncbi:MAG TPA: MarR family transcriptional regulator [Gammaproteobacteria bacterium]|nr:MarR family transcriptional regulator [Gammaproteobacteria bacterium]
MPKNAEAYGSWMKLERPEHIVGFLLKSLQHTLRQRMDEAMRTHGIELSFAHFAALFGLHSEPGSNGAKLARRAFVSAQTMNSVLRRLEDDGYIERRPHPDSRRADSWFLTDEGLEQLERARGVGQRVFDRMLGSLDADELERFESYLKRCISALEEPDLDAGEAPAARRRQKVAARKISDTRRV